MKTTRIKGFIKGLAETVLFTALMFTAGCGIFKGIDTIDEKVKAETNETAQIAEEIIEVEEGADEDKKAVKNENNGTQNEIVENNEAIEGEEVEPETIEEAEIEIIEEEPEYNEVIEQIETETAEIIEAVEENETSEEGEMFYLGRYEITAYCWTGNPCANGNYPATGYTIACNSLPFGSVVYIDGIGYRTVEDRGADWHAVNWIDLYLGDEASCWEWGVQYLDVYLVE